MKITSPLNNLIQIGLHSSVQHYQSYTLGNVAIGMPPILPYLSIARYGLKYACDYASDHAVVDPEWDSRVLWTPPFRLNVVCKT